MYHLSVGFVSRSTGRSAVQSAAYITGSTLYESRRDLTVTYKNRHSDIAFTTTLIPDHIPTEKKAAFSTLSVWDTFESFEDRYAQKRFPHSEESREKYLTSAQTAMTIVVALPKELSLDSCKELVEEFAKTRFVSRGLITTVAIHDDEGNPHAHLQIARRAVNEKGEIAWAKDRQICTRSELLFTRKLWADLANQYLEREGVDERITEKSFAALGVNLEPTQHRGWYADKLQQEHNIPSRIVLENQKVFDDNRQKLMDNPTLILEEITSTQATFTQLQLLTALQKRVGDEAPLVAALFEQALSQAVMVGEGLDGQVRYTSASYKTLEEKACKHLEDLLKDTYSSQAFRKISEDQRQDLLHTKYTYLSPEQQNAVHGLTQAGQLSVLIGRAGAGKTTTLKAVAQAYQEAGYHVIGTSLSALAAENLENETGVSSSTLHSLLYRWQTYQTAQEKFLSFNSIMEEGALKQLQWYKDLKAFEGSKLTANHVVMVDEAGMIGTRQWSELLSYVSKAGAKVIAVGDDHQFKAIEAGDFFRAMKDRAGEQGTLFRLETIRRQKTVWMRQASQELAELQIQHALTRYEKEGHIHQTERTFLVDEMAKDYVTKIDKGEQGLVLAFTKAQVQNLNEAIRRELKAQGHIGDKTLMTMGERSFAQGDKIVFLKNTKTDVQILDHRGHPIPQVFIKNGTTGNLESMNEKGEVTVRLNESQKAVFHQEAYQALDYGYALTTHKAQGQTVDFTLVVASKNIEAKGLYVAMTRHREDVQLYYTKEDFPTFGHLTGHLSRFEPKDLVKDYTIRSENEAAWQRVQEYRACVLDAASVLKEGHREGSVDWKAYRAIKQDQIALGQEILRDFPRHKLYLEQAGLTQEMLQITIGHKPRPLSLVEERAKLTVELYGETAQRTRSLGQEVRGRDLSHDTSFQEKYHQFQDLRAERDSLAKEILDHYPLHRPFVNEFSKTYGLSKKTLHNQGTYRERQEKVKEGALQKSYDNALDKPYNKSLKNKENHDKRDQINHNDNNSYGKYKVNSGINRDNNSEYNTKYSQAYKSSLMRSSAEITASLNAQIKDLAFHFLGKPRKQTVKEWRYGSKGSLSIHVAGTKQGLYSNFETGTSGNAVRLIAEQLGLDSKEAFKWGAQWLYGDDRRWSPIPSSSSHKDFLTHPKPVRDKTWTPLFPAPKDYPDLKKEPSLSGLMKGRQEVARYAYKDADGHILGYVVRLEDKDGHKITPMLTYCRRSDGKEAWRFQGFGDQRPLYGLEQLKERPHAPVLVVEGEKTADAAKQFFKEHVVLTWSGGCGAVHTSDWSVLKSKDVTIWPDHDKPGVKAAHKIASLLEQNDKQTEHDHAVKTNIKIVDLPSSLPHKWDLADPLPKGLQHEALQTLLHKAYPLSVEKTFERTPLTSDPMEKIHHLMKDNRLHLSFGALEAKHYQDIQTIAQALKDLNHASGQTIHEDGILKRATFLVCYLKDQIHHTSLSMEDTQKLALIASQQFANQKEPGTLSSNSDAHFKALGTLRMQQCEQQQYSSTSVNREKGPSESPSPALSKAEQTLHTLVQRITQDYRASYQAHQLQQIQERQLRLMKDQERMR